MSMAIDKMRFTLKIRISLYERIASFLDAGIDLTNALEAIQARYKKSKDYRGKVLSNWLSELKKGKDFSTAIKPWVPFSEFMLINAGVETGNIAEGLRKTIMLSKSSAENKGAIIGGLVMPIFLFLMLFMLIVGFRVKMVPVFEGILPISEWPSMAHSLNDLASGVYDNLNIIIFIMVGSFAAIVSTLNIWHGKIRSYFDYLPPWSLYRNFQGSSFLISLSALMSSGIPGYTAIEDMNRNASPWMKYHLKQMMAKMKKGGNAGTALDTGMIDKETAGNIADYSKLGSFENAIDQIGTKALSESVIKTKIKMKAISTLLLFVVAGSVVTIYYAIFDLQNAVAEKSQSRT